MQTVQIDTKATRMKAELILRDYRKFEQMAGTEYVSNVTATYSFEPKSYTGTIGTPIQNHLERKILAESLVKEINCAINKINDSLFRAILIKKYCDSEFAGNDDLMFDLKIAPSTFYRKLEDALVQFAIHFKNGEDVIYRDDNSIENYMRSLLE